MIRLKISFGIIIAIIILGVSGFFMLKNKSEGIIDMIDQTMSLSDDGKTAEALESVDKLIKEWDSFHTYASVLINNDKISSAQDSISRLKSLIKSNDGELNAEFDNAKAALKWIIESEIPRWSNIL